MMSPEWERLKKQEFEKEYFHKLKAFITQGRTEVHVLPAPSQLWKPFELCEFKMLKVIIIGQDPYPSREDACGLAFSSNSNKTPYSLKNIFDEIYQDCYGGNT